LPEDDITSLLTAELPTIQRHRRAGHIRDCPEDYEETPQDTGHRKSYGFGPSSKLLAKLRSVSRPLREALACKETDAVVLESEAPGAGQPSFVRQPLHFDFNQQAYTRLREVIRRKRLRVVVPWTLLVTFSPGGKLYFKVGGKMVVVVLKRPGDAVLFRGNVLHGGAAYRVEHWRCHFYWEPKEEDYQPPRGEASYREEFHQEGKAFLKLYGVETHVERGGTWSMASRDPAEFVLYGGEGVSLEEMMRTAKFGALVV
jgi:hypothetical protein